MSNFLSRDAQELERWLIDFANYNQYFDNILVTVNTSPYTGLSYINVTISGFKCSIDCQDGHLIRHDKRFPSVYIPVLKDFATYYKI
ncbi:hypothetical protein [Listeria fleischmannii]|uniref:Uncharacterized protein n=1 Tax=Listeria fleischmannii FSL S10-1203 TaxID=1265822 RepID=W7DGC2_9LIST|nr:hypothetical protein [Listeria fleischmannii]EUJ48677.1 hypothetical protein MCOL2_17067 [Listeria fleischmannii FSL S10-1203]